MKKYMVKIWNDEESDVNCSLKGDIDMIVAGLLTALEKIIVEYDVDKKAIIKVWSESNMAKED